MGNEAFALLYGSCSPGRVAEPGGTGYTGVVDVRRHLRVLLAARRTWAVGSSRRTTAHLQIVSRMAGEIADGDMAGLVVLDCARAMVDVLGLVDCRFEVPPFVGDTTPCLRRDGWLTVRGAEWDPTAIGLPERGFSVPVVARGRTEGRFVCTPRPRRLRRPSAERIAVALTLAGQAASALLLESVA